MSLGVLWQCVLQVQPELSWFVLVLLSNQAAALL
jgi:hypothetical protein